ETLPAPIESAARESARTKSEKDSNLSTPARNASGRAETQDGKGPQVARRAAGNLVGHHDRRDGSKEDAVAKMPGREVQARQARGTEDGQPVRTRGPQAGPGAQKRRLRQGGRQPGRRGDQPLDGAGGDLFLEPDPFGRGPEKERLPPRDHVDIPGFEDRREPPGRFDLHD